MLSWVCELKVIGEERCCISFANTGKGGLFFERLYEDRAWTAEVRKHPATQEEMLKAGMSVDDIEHYLDLIRQLYSELF